VIRRSEKPKAQSPKLKLGKPKAEMVKAEIAGFQFSVSSISAFSFQLSAFLQSASPTHGLTASRSWTLIALFSLIGLCF
jgi:hypothetical protein